MTIEALNGGEQSRVTIELDFKGHGIGNLVVRIQARNEMPADCRKLKQRLESLPSPSPA
ncbi:MAG: hypothetical protein ACYDC4_05620 [Candidatus Dormibacteria bacterium]